MRRYDAKLAYGLGGIFREKIEKCEKCKSLDFTIIDHPIKRGLIVLECGVCSTIYVTVDRRGE